MADLGILLASDKAKFPTYGSADAACFDIYATGYKPTGNRSRVYETGLMLEIPKGWHVKIYSRSGNGFRDDLRLANSTGIIDSDYKGLVGVKLVYDGLMTPDWPIVGDRIAQGMLVKNTPTKLVRVYELTETERGEGGFGSSGR